MALDKYKKFMKEKVQSATTETVTAPSGKRKYTSYFNPNNALLGKTEVVVRVLPNKDGLFFQQYKKHSFKIGTRKNAVCFYSRDNNGLPIGNSCPFCDFIEENKKVLSKDVQYTLSAKDSYIILIFNHAMDEIQKYEVNDYGITDILTAMNALDGLDPDAEGFNIHFTKDSKGYARVTKASKPESTVDELLEASKNVKEIPDIFKETIPFNNQIVKDSIQSLFELALQAFAPTFASTPGEANPKEESSTQYDPNSDEDFNEPKSNNEVVDTEEDPESDSGVDDIKKFLEGRKKK